MLVFGGYAAKTVVYCLLGVLILKMAIGVYGSDSPSQKNVFLSIIEQPFGRIMLGCVIVGMACYVVWRFVQASMNIDNLDMSSAKDVVKRVFYFVSGIIYAFGTYLAIKVFHGSSGSSSGGQSNSEEMSSTLMQQQWGIYLVAAVGIIIVIFSFIQFKHAFKADFMDKFDVHRMSAKIKKISQVVGRMGFFARGIVYILVGGFFIQAAYKANPEEAGGLKEALDTIIQQSYGQYALMVVGAGIFLFGIFCAIESRYHKTSG
ncbi:DUF1206 domain-containing protein [Salinimonas sp. HHU 13199]|uniref:DUF1206 domain-containing protein n=2 Tax=Salinimonas profundi TaxID=2729140 RepID=A0ABR8LN00_9ALTE|nr:DUF1206 domain-containing protein [Salinimonas profundi]